MRIIRCMSCQAAKRRPNYWHDWATLDEQQRRVFAATPRIYELGGLRYCENCLIHAQAVLTELLGYDRVNNWLNSDLKNRLKDFGTPNPAYEDRIFWHTTYFHVTTGKANHE